MVSINISGIRGALTVGTGRAGSDGTVNIGRGGRVAEAINELIHEIADANGQRGGRIVVLPGDYELESHLDLFAQGVEIELTRGARLIPSHSGSVGVARLSGKYATIRGGEVYVEHWVNGQVVIDADGAFRPQVRDVVFEIPTVAGNTTTPMTMVRVYRCLEAEVEDCFVLPNRGVRFLHVYEGSRGSFNRNKIRNSALHGIGGTGEPPAMDPETEVQYGKPRLLYEGFRIEGGQWHDCCDNQVWYLGDEEDPVNEVFFYNRTATDGSEQGHFRLSRNKVEGIWPTKALIRLHGPIWSEVSHNKLGWGRGALKDFGAAAIYVSSRLTNGTEGTSESSWASSCAIHDNDIHNFAASHVPPVGGGNDSLATSIYIGWCVNSTFKQNLCTLQFGSSAMIVNLAQAGNIDIDHNRFASNDQTGEYAIAFVGGTVAANVNIGAGNTFLNYLRGGVQPGITAGLNPTGLVGYTFVGGAGKLGISGSTLVDTTTYDPEQKQYPKLLRIPVGAFVWLSGFSNAGNNGLKLVTAVAADGTSITLESPTSLTNETPAGAVTLRLISTNRDQT